MQSLSCVLLQLTLILVVLQNRQSTSRWFGTFDEPDVVHMLIKAVRDAVPAHIPVSAKMRLGYLDENHTMENAHAVEDAGASWLTVHARTKSRWLYATSLLGKKFCLLKKL